MEIFGSSTKTINTKYLKIHGNCLEFNDTVIQLRNISLFSTSDIAPPAFPVAALITLVLGAVLFVVQFLIALVLLVVGGLWIFFWYRKVQEIKAMRRLTIVTNSHDVFAVIFSDLNFLNQVVMVLTSIIDHPAVQASVVMDIASCQFDIHGNSFRDGASVIQQLTENTELKGE